jgi:hypothetical protein
MLRPSPRKYDPLAAYLAALPADEVTLTFAAIERIIGAALPVSAWARTWWANTGGTPQARAWLGAGWRVAAVNFSLEAVTFVRLPPGSTGQPFTCRGP